MTWALVLGLGAGAYACKALGMVAFGERHLPPAVERCLALVPAALLSALVVRDTLSTGQSFDIDARVAGVAVAALAAWRRAPFVVVMVLGAAVAAGLRQAGVD